MATSNDANKKLETIQVVPDDVADSFNTDNEGMESIMSRKPDELVNNDAGAEACVPRLMVEDNSSTVPKQFQEDDGDDEVMTKYRSFKSFDTVDDFSDNHYKSYSVTESQQASRKWTKAIQRDWRLLEKDLPDTIFVRAYEERMDLLRAVIVGAAGTPYHDGLFFFDIHFPSCYPDTPPLVHYHAHNLRLNPNLYENGKVCLSLLNTWSGGIVERWTPGKSTMLQVLLSIQALVLNEKPYFNEPACAPSAGTEYGEMASRDYNQSTFILSCRTMLYTLKNPPKYFEDYVLGHFRLRAYTILAACKAYIEGAQVGSVIDEVQDDNESQKSDSSKKEVGRDVDVVRDVNDGQMSSYSWLFNRFPFKSEVRAMLGKLIPVFISKGAKNCEQFISLGESYRSSEADYKPVEDQAEAQFQPFAHWPAQAPFQLFAHPRPRAKFPIFAYSPAQAQFPPSAHWPAQVPFQPFAHPRPRAKSPIFAYSPAQAQFPPPGHWPDQAQFPSYPHSPAQAQYQPSAQFPSYSHSPAQAQFPSFSYWLTQPQFLPYAHWIDQPRFPSYPHSPAQFSPYPHFPAQAQCPPAHWPVQAQFPPSSLSPVQAQFPPSAHSVGAGVSGVHVQAQAHDQAEAHFGTNDNNYSYLSEDI